MGFYITGGQCVECRFGGKVGKLILKAVKGFDLEKSLQNCKTQLQENARH